MANGKLTKRFGHYREMQNYQRSIKNNLTRYQKNSIEDNDDDLPPGGGEVEAACEIEIEKPPGYDPIYDDPNVPLPDPVYAPSVETPPTEPVNPSPSGWIRILRFILGAGAALLNN